MSQYTQLVQNNIVLIIITVQHKPASADNGTSQQRLCTLVIKPLSNITSMLHTVAVGFTNYTLLHVVYIRKCMNNAQGYSRVILSNIKT